MGYADGDDPVSGAILSYQQVKRMKNNFYQATTPSNLQSGMIYIDSDDDKAHLMGASATEEILQVTRSRDKDAELHDNIFHGLNILTKDGNVLTKDGEVLFKGYND